MHGVGKDSIVPELLCNKATSFTIAHPFLMRKVQQTVCNTIEFVGFHCNLKRNVPLLLRLLYNIV